MTRKDYVLLADALRESAQVETNRTATVIDITDRIADRLKMDNPRFDRGRFVSAVFGDGAA